MDKEIITFGDIEVEKHKFRQYKNQISMFLLGKRVLNILLGMEMLKKCE